MIEINGKIYRNIQEQVGENQENIEALDTRVTALENAPAPTPVVYTEGAGIDILNNVISVDATIVPYKIDLATVAFTGDYDDLTDKPTIPTKTSDLINDSFVTTDSMQYVTATKIFKTEVGASTGASIFPSSGSFFAEKEGTSTSFAPQKISLSKSQAATPFNFQIHSSQGDGHNGVYTFDNSVTGTVTTKEYVDSIVGNIETLLAAI